MGSLVNVSLNLIVKKYCLFLLALIRNLKTTVLIFQFLGCYLFEKIKFLVMKIHSGMCLDNNIKVDNITSRPYWIIPGEWLTPLSILSLCKVLFLHVLKNTESWEHTTSHHSQDHLLTVSRCCVPLTLHILPPAWNAVLWMCLLKSEQGIELTTGSKREMTKWYPRWHICAPHHCVI